MNEKFNIESWVGGIIDGEGWVGIIKTTARRDNAYYRVGVQVCNVNPLMALTLQKHFGGSIDIIRSKKKNERPIFRWYLNDSKATAFLLKIEGSVVCKKEEVFFAIELQGICDRFKGQHYKNIPNVIAVAKEALYLKCKELKHKEWINAQNI